MKISILTPSYNQGKYIARTINSVQNQNWPNVEHIIIDGGSTDNTLEILKKYPHVRWISEPDDGQADALNKGLSMATGDIIGWINSDDYYQENIFHDVVAEFRDQNVNWIIGNITFTYQFKGIKNAIKSPEITYRQLLVNPDIVKQQATFFRKSALMEVGAWNKKYFMTMDYDLWIRLSKNYNPKMIDRQWAFFTHHADQKSTSKNILIQAQNIKDILQREKAAKYIIYKILFKKYFYYLKAILKTILIKLKIINVKYRDIPISITKGRIK